MLKLFKAELGQTSKMWQKKTTIRQKGAIADCKKLTISFITYWLDIGQIQNITLFLLKSLFCDRLTAAKIPMVDLATCSFTFRKQFEKIKHGHRKYIKHNASFEFHLTKKMMNEQEITVTFGRFEKKE